MRTEHGRAARNGGAEGMRRAARHQLASLDVTTCTTHPNASATARRESSSPQVLEWAMSSRKAAKSSASNCGAPHLKTAAVAAQARAAGACRGGVPRARACAPLLQRNLLRAACAQPPCAARRRGTPRRGRAAATGCGTGLRGGCYKRALHARGLRGEREAVAPRPLACGEGMRRAASSAAWRSEACRAGGAPAPGLAETSCGRLSEPERGVNCRHPPPQCCQARQRRRRQARGRGCS